MKSEVLLKRLTEEEIDTIEVLAEGDKAVLFVYEDICDIEGKFYNVGIYSKDTHTLRIDTFGWDTTQYNNEDIQKYYDSVINDIKANKTVVLL